ncbi:phytoene/squalene synthase family protein [Lachnoanaerobaculum gingivalis]|uniref:phytoene/squalene synthase family protein n=1 Tax=Lachnoanaerobaculum gingivalis TaxID=2490855 RepID=UPI0024A6F2B8|nr:phytoene/squalene synthase family protein [Lachnoanaerobaculum gingivalis]WHE86536.1 phytoene/squalene synthase family protein [Lachnoanaerobaculum gingivalis]
MNIESSYQVAESIMRKHASSFYAAFGKVERAKFLDISAVYAFCRYADDLADTKSRSKVIKLQLLNVLEEEVKSLYEGGRQEEQYKKYNWWLAFENAVRIREIPLEALLEQIDGQRSDINFKIIEDKEDLILYCKKVAGTVGLMLAPMLRGEKADGEYESICESLGIAMQITNILRDIGEDLRNRNRIYIPQTFMKKYSVTRKDLEELSVLPNALTIKHLFVKSDFKPADNIVNLWEEMALLSKHYYDKFYKHLYMFSPDAIFPVTAAAVYYQAILEEVRRNNYNCFTKRCYTNAKRKRDLLKRVSDRVEKAKSGNFNCNEVYTENESLTDG